MTDVPTVRVNHLNPTRIRAYVIADNRLAEKSRNGALPSSLSRTIRPAEFQHGGPRHRPCQKLASIYRTELVKIAKQVPFSIT